MSRRMLRFDYLNGIYGKHRRRVLRKQQLAHREAQRAEESLATLVEPLEDRLLLVGDLEIVVDPLVTTVHDETSGLQNATESFGITGDDDDNDILVSELPPDFANRLVELGLDPDSDGLTNDAIGAALSGYDGSNNGADAFTVNPGEFEIANLKFTDGNGADHDGTAWIYDNSPVTATDGGNELFLFTDDGDDNILLIRKGTTTDGGITWSADPDGDIVAALYIQETSTD